MIPSNFEWYIEKYLKPVAQQWPTRVNDTKKPLTYLFKTMLSRQFSPTDQWESFGANQTVVAADYVALDSELPLKKRDSLGSFKGDIPKVGMALPMLESTMKKMRLMRTMGRPIADMARLLSNDEEKVISGVWEANEDVFLRLLSDGVAVIADENKPGLGIRLTLQIEDKNKKFASKVWSTEGVAAPTITDMRAVIDAAEADGNTISHIALTNTMIDFIAKSNEGKQLYADKVGKIDADTSKMANPTRKRMAEALSSELGITVINTTRTIRYEKDGVQTKVTPFNNAHITFLTSDQVGTLWYGTVEEMDSPVGGVAYATSDEYILVSKYRSTNPVKEMTCSQAVVIPMLDNINDIYWFDSSATSIAKMAAVRSTTK